MFCSLSLSHDQNCSYVADCLRPLSPVSPPHCLLRRGDPDGDIIRFWNRSMANVCRTTLMEKSRTSMILATWIHSFEVFILMHGGCAHFDERLKVTCIKHTYTYKNTESALKEMQTGPAELMKALIRARGNSTCFCSSCQCIGTAGVFLLGVSPATPPASVLLLILIPAIAWIFIGYQVNHVHTCLFVGGTNINNDPMQIAISLILSEPYRCQSCWWSARMPLALTGLPLAAGGHHQSPYPKQIIYDFKQFLIPSQRIQI